MRIPLIVCHNSKLNRYGPVVFIPSGNWSLNSNHKDSSPKIIIGGVGSDIKDFIFEGNKEAHIEFTSECKDSSVTIYAESV